MILSVSDYPKKVHECDKQDNSQFNGYQAETEARNLEFPNKTDNNYIQEFCQVTNTRNQSIQIQEEHFSKQNSPDEHYCSNNENISINENIPNGQDTIMKTNLSSTQQKTCPMENNAIWSAEKLTSYFLI